ncbi:right-handed parallel beta-helix repeat-containing protein [Exiguobacterium sp. SH5S4]|uniref:right-handed parallel beta-helix repeat-containing protein n=1 Tax=Exiguobacterium sp. SH5S4 TaxID=2510961 RepID=UPI00103DEC5F|nr:right-handed parallel beta-helix repeat-containing protein [Exiguobacterium sp. SH5S4]TCI27143.1 right-handed parallel beta-helix repeat-containing protein [Exiguobacterium sp. SH5S4]
MPKHLPKVTSGLAIASLLLTSSPIPSFATSVSNPVSQIKQNQSLKTFPLNHLTVINDSAIRLGKTHFRITKDQAAFFKANQQALTNARLAVRYSENRKIEEIIGLEINQHGKNFNHPITLNGLHQSFSGMIRINARNVILQNVKAVNYVYLTNHANATTQFVNVNAEKLSQASLPKTSQRQSAPLSRIIIQAGTFDSIDLQRTNTRLQARGNTVLNEVRSFANTSIQSTAAARIQDVLSGHQVTSLHLNGDVSTIHNASRTLSITGKSTIGDLVMKTKQARLDVEVSGTVARLKVLAADTTISVNKDATVDTVEFNASAKFQSIQPLKKVGISGEKSVIDLDASVDQLVATNETVLSIGKNRTINSIQAEDRLTVEGSGMVKSLELGERVKDVVLHVPIATMTVKGKGQDAIRVSGSASIERVVLDGEAPLTLDVPKVNHVEATEANTGTIDTRKTEVGQNDVTEEEVVPPSPPIETPVLTPPVVTPPVVTPPIVEPIDPPEEETSSTTEELFEFYKTSIDSDFIAWEDVTIGGFESKKHMYIHVPKDVTLTVNEPITGGHQIQFMGEGTVYLEEPSLLNNQKMNFEESIQLPVFPEGIFSSIKSDLFPEMPRTFFARDSLQEAINHGDIVYLEKDVEIDEPLQARRVHIKSSRGATIRASEQFNEIEAHGYGFLFIVRETNHPITLEGISFSHRNGAGLLVTRADDVTLKHVTFVDNKQGAIVVENADLNIDYLYTKDNGGLAIRIENWFDGDASSVTVQHAAMTEETPIVTSTGGSKIELSLPDEFVAREDQVTRETQWVRQEGIYKLKRNGTTERFTNIEQATSSVESFNQIVINGKHPVAKTIELSEEVVLRGEHNGTLTAANDFDGDDLIQLNRGSYTGSIEQLTVEGAPRYGINIINKGDAVLKNVTSRNNGVGGVMANSSHVTAYGLTTEGNTEFGVGIEVIEDASTRSHFYFDGGELKEPIAAISHSHANGANADFIDFTHTFEEVKEGAFTKWVKARQQEIEGNQE